MIDPPVLCDELRVAECNQSCVSTNKGNNKITELRTLQRESLYKQTKSVNNRKTVKTVMIEAFPPVLCDEWRVAEYVISPVLVPMIDPPVLFLMKMTFGNQNKLLALA